MRRFWLLLVLALPVLGILVPASPEWAVAQKSKDDSEQPAEEPLAPETAEKLRLTLNPGGHTGAVAKVFFTPDSKQIVTASADHSIRIWDALSGETVRVLHPPGFGSLSAAALSPDGKTLAVGSRYPDGDNTLHVICLLSLADGRIERVLKGHPHAVETVVFSADGKRLASTSAGVKDGTVLIWDPSQDEPARAFAFKGDPLYRTTKRGLAFSPDGNRLARVRLSGGSGDILDLTTGKAVAKLKGMGPIAWSPDGKTLATPIAQTGGGGHYAVESGWDGTPEAGWRAHVSFGCFQRRLAQRARDLGK